MLRVRASRRIWLCQLLYLLFSMVWFVFAAFSTMMVDRPFTLANIHLMIMLGFIWLYPLGAIFSIVLSWLHYRKGRFKLARRTILLPLLWVIPIVSLCAYALWG
ncbi:MAG: hypothetical protein K6T85_05045 [Gorillibacterium sp.]|nr:hypothetical protein [Gorillibacterium sp.]